MTGLFKKGLFLAGIYIVMQLIYMVVVWLIFRINLFESEKSVVVMTDLSQNSLKLMIGLNQLFGLLLPAVIYLYVIYREKAARFVFASIPERFEIALFGLAALFMSFSAIQFLTHLNAQLPIGNIMEETAVEINQYMLKIVAMDGPADLIVNLLLIGILPAVSEELLFRGTIQNELVKHLPNPHVAIWVTAIIFSAFHFQFDGFLPRMCLGALLGYSYYYSRNIFVPMLMHFTNNAILVMAVYMNPAKLDDTVQQELAVNWVVLILTTALTVYFVYLIKRRTSHENT